MSADIAAPRWLKAAVFTSGAVMLASGALFYTATQRSMAPLADGAVKVRVGDSSCDPMDLRVAAGRMVFEITNASNRPIEWEILDGNMVLEERENILPGLNAVMTAKLKPGTFAITCGLLSNPRGVLLVTPSASFDAERASPPLTAFIGPLSEAKVYLVSQSGALLRALEALSLAVQAGDIPAAQAAWLSARAPYKRIEPIAARFADLENAIDPLPDYFAAKEDDPAFMGFHRLELALWLKGDLTGMEPVAQDLVTAVTALRTALRDIALQPADLADLAARQAGHLARGQALSGENRWSDSDSADLGAAIEGVTKIAGLVLPLVKDADPQAAAAYQAAVAALGTAVTATAPDLRPSPQTAARLTALEAAITALNPAIGLE